MTSADAVHAKAHGTTARAKRDEQVLNRMSWRFSSCAPRAGAIGKTVTNDEQNTITEISRIH